MAEEWLKKLAEQIKAKDHEAAEEVARAVHQLEIIEHHGPVFWRSFTGFLKKYVNDMIEDLEADVTLREGKLSCDVDLGNSKIDIRKAAFPYVQFSATPQYNQRIATIVYATVNPMATQNQSIGTTNMPCHFEVTNHDKVFLHLDGKEFHEPQEAAKHVMEKLFTIQS
jgi:hypothetical protein